MKAPKIARHLSVFCVTLVASIMLAAPYALSDDQQNTTTFSNINTKTGETKDPPKVIVDQVVLNQDQSISVTLTILTKGGMQAKGANAPSSQSLSSSRKRGIEPIINGAGRNRSDGTLTVSMTLTNNSDSTYYLVHVGPPSATDNTGNQYVRGGQVTGIYDDANFLYRNSEEKGKLLQNMTRLDPRASLTLNFRLLGKGKGPVISFSSTLAAREVTDLIKDGMLSDEQKAKSIHTLNISVASVAVTEEKQ